MRHLFLLFLAFTFSQVWAQSYTYVPSKTQDPNPAIVECNSGLKKAHVCIVNINITDKDSERGSVVQAVCGSSSNTECPSAQECYEQYKKNQANKKIEFFAITGNNRAENNVSVPATKSCDLIPKQSISGSKRVKIKCGELDAYLDYNQLVDEFKFKNFILKSKDYTQFNLTPGALVMAMNGHTDGQLLNIKELLISKGIVFDKAGNASVDQITFSYTPKSKDPILQMQIYAEPSGSRRYTVCASQTPQKCHMEAEPIEFQTPFCDNAIVVGSRDCAGEKKGQKLSCFVKKNEIYCLDASRCGNDDFTKEPLMWKPAKIKEYSKK